MKVLMVVTSHSELGSTGHGTGLWLEELAAPYYVFADAGAEITLATPKGGKIPLDPNSEGEASQTDATRRFNADAKALEALATATKLDAVKAADFDLVFYPGGHGVLWDLVENAHSNAILEETVAANKPLGSVCHGPAVFLHPKKADGSPLVAGKRVTGFSNSEEAAVGLTQVVPFLVEDMLKSNGGTYSSVADWQPHVVVDGLLVTGQNPASSEGVARELLALAKR